MRHAHRLWLLAIVSSLTSACGHGDFDNKAQFARFIEEFHLKGLEPTEAKARLTKVGFRCSTEGNTIYCNRTRRKGYWLRHEAQFVTLTYDSDRVVTLVDVAWTRPVL